MKLYISGPITGKPDGNRVAFLRAYLDLTECGFEAVNPHEIDPTSYCSHGGAPTWEDHMRADIAELMTCDAVATLPCWVESRGACIEVHLAQALGMLVQSVDAWIEGAST